MIYLQDADFTLYQGDALEVLRTLPDESVHMCVTSPPFYGLRDYGTGTWQGGDAECDHASAAPSRDSDEDVQRRKAGYEESGRSTGQHGGWEGRAFRGDGQARCKCGATRIDRQIGLEETPEQWVQKLVEVFREVRRVLRKDGTLWLEVGDSYGANQGKGFNTQAENGYAEVGRNRIDLSTPIKHPYKPKDLIGAPWLLAFALRADGWYLRSDIIWSRPNPMPESVTDRPTKSHSYVFLLSKSPRYFFDQEAVREPLLPSSLERGYTAAYLDGEEAEKTKNAPAEVRAKDNWRTNGYVPAGRNIRSVWNIATQPYPEAHFATYPEELVRRCILAGTSERGCCAECGAPWVRETIKDEDAAPSVSEAHHRKHGHKPNASPRNPDRADGGGMTQGGFGLPAFKTLGWHPSCECSTRNTDGGRIGRPRRRPPDERSEKQLSGWGSSCEHGSEPTPCTVLDPFSGSGTTALVARKHGRKCIGIELSADYCELTARRLQQLSLLAEA